VFLRLRREEVVMLSRRMLTTSVPVIAAMVVFSIVAPFALADKGGGGHGGKGGGGGTTSGGGGGSTSGSTSTLGLSSESIYWPDTWEPNCMTEDDRVVRSFSGSLYGSYSTSFQLCGLSTDGWTAGGEGIQSEVGVSGTLSDLTITAPDGTVTHGVYTGTSKGISYYQVCVVPPYYAATDTGTGPLVGGTWTVTLSGSISSASWEAQVTMTDVNFQQANCPASQQNIIN
jgi:hypothetical protein